MDPPPPQVLFFRVFQHLLPKGRAWLVTVAKPLRSLFEGLAEWPDDFRSFIDQVWWDTQPSKTRELAEWEQQFGLYTSASEEHRRLWTALEWSATVGPSPDLLTDALTAVGFHCRVYGPWIELDDYVDKPLLWARTDDPAKTVSVLQRITSIPNRGKLGGALNAINSGPDATSRNNRTAGYALTTGGLRFGSSPEPALNILHEPATNATVTAAFFLTSLPGVLADLFLTKTGANALGFRLAITSTGKLSLTVGNGFADSVTLTGATTLTLAPHIVQVRKTGTTFEVFLDGSLDVSTGAAPILYTGDASRAPEWGAGLYNFSGELCEIAVFASALSNARLAEQRAILARWNSGSGLIARDPRTYTTPPLIGTARCGDGVSSCGGSEVSANRFLSNEPGYFVNKDLTGNAPPPIPSDSSKWWGFLYVAGLDGIDSTFYVDPLRRAELERQILKIRPLEGWVVNRANYAASGFIVTDLDGWFSVDSDGFVEVVA